MSKAEQKTKFENVFLDLIEEVDAIVAETKIAQPARDWIRESLKYNTFGGKLNRGLSVIDTYKLVTNQSELSEAEYKKAAVLGWTVELLQAYFLVADDIMDASKTRRGQPCWYLQPKVGMIAINDAFIIESVLYLLLKKYFRDTNYYVDLLELYHEITWFTELGQLLDLITAPEDDVDLSRFSLDKHTYIVTYKTAFYSFYLPVALALHMAGIATPKNLAQCKKVLLPLGAYFQVQDDYLDCYGDPEVIGKIGTDIQDNKCGWVINVALEKASPAQRAILEVNYGHKNAAREELVKRVFQELKIEPYYHEYEEKVAGEIKTLIENIDESEGLKKQVFTEFFNKIYKRQK